MISEHERSSIVRRAYDLDPFLLALAESDAQGIPLAGRTAENAALRRTGARNASLGRIFEGHLNGAQLVARCGTAEQRDGAHGAIAQGHIFGVWNTQADDDRLRIERRGSTLALAGSKTWASGAGSITRPIVTAAWPGGGVQMILLRMEKLDAHIDASAWKPLGMLESDSFRVSFDGVVVDDADLIGEPGDYERQPWFFAGALRFAAVQTGIIEHLFAQAVAYLRQRGRDADPFQCARIAEMKIGVRTAVGWLDAGVAAWSRFDADPTARNAADVLDVVDMARTVVERVGIDVIERTIRSVGARGLVEPEPFGPLVRDLQMYLRQPAPDAALLRVGRAAFAQDA